MDGFTLELGGRVASYPQAYRMGGFPPHHGGNLDLGIYLARYCTLAGIRRNRVVDRAGCLQLSEGCYRVDFTSLILNKVVRNQVFPKNPVS